MKKTVILLLLTLLTLRSTPTIYAADATGSGGLADKLEQLKEEIASKAAALKKVITAQLENKAFVGIVKTKSDNSMTIATQNGSKVISINQDTDYQDSTKKQKNFSLKSISEEDNIAALGDVDDTGVLVAKRIVLLPDPPATQKTFLWGQILSVTDKLITIRDRSAKSISISTTNSTSIQKQSGKLSYDDLNINDYAIVTGYFGDDKEATKTGVLKAVFIYISKQANPTTSPTSKPTPAKSATPTPKSSD